MVGLDNVTMEVAAPELATHVLNGISPEQKN